MILKAGVRLLLGHILGSRDHHRGVESCFVMVVSSLGLIKTSDLYVSLKSVSGFFGIILWKLRPTRIMKVSKAVANQIFVIKNHTKYF